MRLDITGRHVDITASLRQLIDRALAKLERLLNDSAISAQVILTKEKYRHRTEIIIHARGDHMLRGLGEGTALAGLGPRGGREDRAAGADAERQVGASASGAAPAREPSTARRRRDRSRSRRRRVIVRATRYAVKPMSIEDAALRVDPAPETFVVFRNAETDAVSILYRRRTATTA